MPSAASPRPSCVALDQRDFRGGQAIKFLHERVDLAVQCGAFARGNVFCVSVCSSFLLFRFEHLVDQGY